MNCTGFETLIALYAGRDLDDRDAVRVEEHLTECAGCRGLLEDLRDGQSALKEWGTEAVDPIFLSAVRASVLAGIGDRGRRAWPWVAALAVAAGLIAAVIATPRKVVPIPVVKAPEKKVEAVHVSERQAEPPAPPLPRLPRRRVGKRAPEPSTAEPLVVKMLTDDPDIVIIWLVDQRGD